MAKTQPPPATRDTEPEGLPLAVITREPSDEELHAELSAMAAILHRYEPRRAEYAHAAVALDAAVDWIRRASVPPPDLGQPIATTDTITP